MRTSFHLPSVACLVIAAVSIVGCGDPAQPVTTDVQADHGHKHTGHRDHEDGHEHGAHGTHSHSHRHGEPLHGGRVVTIGHTHHGKGETHFHAEVMPVVGDTVRFHLLTESEDGESIDLPIEQKEISALISIKSRETKTFERPFVAVGDGEQSAEFELTIPKQLTEGQSFSVVVPKITLGGHRQNFSFVASRPEDSHGDKADESPQEAQGEPVSTETPAGEAEAPGPSTKEGAEPAADGEESDPVPGEPGDE